MAGAAEVIMRSRCRCRAALTTKLREMRQIYYGVGKVNALKNRHAHRKLVDNETSVKRWGGGLRETVMKRGKRNVGKVKKTSWVELCRT